MHANELWQLWQETGARGWVEAHGGAWNHHDWLALLDDLRGSGFWPMQPDAVGAALETAKAELARTPPSAATAQDGPTTCPMPVRGRRFGLVRATTRAA